MLKKEGKKACREMLAYIRERELDGRGVSFLRMGLDLWGRGQESDAASFERYACVASMFFNRLRRYGLAWREDPGDGKRHAELRCGLTAKGEAFLDRESAGCEEAGEQAGYHPSM